MQWDCRFSTGLPPSSRLCRLWSWKEDLLEGGPETTVKPEQKSCVRSSGIITLSAQQPSDGSGRGPPQMRPEWPITSGSPMQWDNANRRIPVSNKYPRRDWTRALHDGKQRVDPLDQWDCVGMPWDCRLCTGRSISSVCKRITSICFFINEQITNFHLHNEQTVNMIWSNYSKTNMSE